MFKVYKTSSAGNIFLHIARADFEQEEVKRLIRSICSKERGLAADGITVFDESELPVNFQIFNADGSEAELSGNGLAGLATLLTIKNGQNSFRFKTAIGERKVQTEKISPAICSCLVEIAIADFSNKKFFPLNNSNQLINYQSFQFHPVVVGNPHIVALLNKIPDEEEMNKIFEWAQNDIVTFPQRTNVEFVVLNGKQAEVRFYERGVGPTLASSTGSAAVFAVINKIYHFPELQINTQSGKTITTFLSAQKMISVSVESELLFSAEIYFF